MKTKKDSTPDSETHRKTHIKWNMGSVERRHAAGSNKSTTSHNKKPISLKSIFGRLLSDISIMHDAPIQETIDTPSSNNITI